MAGFCANALRLIAWRRCVYMLECPLSSVMPEHPALKQALEDTGAVRMFMCQGWAGAFSLKPTVLWTNAPYATSLRALFQRRLFTSNVCRGLASKGKWVTGNRYMQQSAVYPIEFCHMMLSTHDTWVLNLKREFRLVLRLAVWPLLRLRLHPGGCRMQEGLGEVELLIYFLLMV